jgi:hypothetical protein
VEGEEDRIRLIWDKRTQDDRKKNKKTNVIRNVLNPKKPKKRMLIKQDTTDIIGSVGEFRVVIAF